MPVIGTYTEYVTIYRAGSSPLAGSISSDQIQFLLDAVNSAVCRFCGIQFTNTSQSQQTFTEYLNGNGSNTIRVANIPVVAITSITVYKADGSSEVLDSTTYRVNLNTGTIARTVDGSNIYVYTDNAEYAPDVNIGDALPFPEGFQNIKVIYTGGYTSTNTPPDLRNAVYRYVDLMIADSVLPVGSANMSAEGLGLYNYTRRPADESDAMFRTLFRPFEGIRM